MKYNSQLLTSYSKVYKGVVPNEICDQTVKEMDNLQYQEHYQ